MTIARAHLIDASVTRWYHCVTRCVRRAFLLGEGPNDRKVRIDDRLRELARIFSVAVGRFSGLESSAQRQRRRIKRISESGGIALAVSDRGPATD